MHRFECPTCGKQFEAPGAGEAPYRPFCSKRCKMVDLGRWLDGSYRISEPIAPSSGADERAEQDDPRA